MFQANVCGRQRIKPRAVKSSSFSCYYGNDASDVGPGETHERRTGGRPTARPHVVIATAACPATAHWMWTWRRPSGNLMSSQTSTPSMLWPERRAVTESGQLTSGVDWHSQSDRQLLLNTECSIITLASFQHYMFLIHSDNRYS